MKIQSIDITPFEISLSLGTKRNGLILTLSDDQGNQGVGEIAPLPGWSRESLSEASGQLSGLIDPLRTTAWALENWTEQLRAHTLYPSVNFGVESALLTLLDPLPSYTIPVSALLMGSRLEILLQAAERTSEGFTYAKLKMSQLSFDEAAGLIDQLRSQFRLRIDLNRAWSKAEALRFFSRYPVDAFDYIEEPFQKPDELAAFSLPLAVDESFPENLTLEQLEALPNLKALIYKPTIQGGWSHCQQIHRWATQRGIDLVLSSTFESDIGLALIGSLAHRLGLKTPSGLGTYHYLKRKLAPESIKMANGMMTVNEGLNEQILR